MKKYSIEELENYATDFLEWCNNHSDDDWKYRKFKGKTVKDVLLIYKK
jgi:hypothetical protein